VAVTDDLHGGQKKTALREGGPKSQGILAQHQPSAGDKGARLGTRRIPDSIIESRSHSALKCDRRWLSLGSGIGVAGRQSRMKEGTMRKIDVPIDELETVIDVAVVEWDEPPESVLSKVDTQLAEHGLEVVIYDAFDNAVSWRIEVRHAMSRSR
jgi:hypothetical protein